MAENPRNCGWCGLYMLVSIFGGILIQSVLLPSLNYEGVYKGWFALAIDVLVVIRIIVAKILKQTDRGWIFYCILMWLSGPLIMFIFWLSDISGLAKLLS